MSDIEARLAAPGSRFQPPPPRPYGPVAIFGDPTHVAPHARSAIGVVALPKNVPVSV